MARLDSSAGGRLAAALGPAPRPMPPAGTWPPGSAVDPPTVPLLFAQAPAPLPDRPLPDRPLPGPSLPGRPLPGPSLPDRPLPGPSLPDPSPPDPSPPDPSPPEAPVPVAAGRGSAVVAALLPASWRGARVDPGRPGATALALVAALAAVVAAVGVWAERPRAEPVGALPAVVVTSEEPSAAPPVSAEPSGPLVVAVSGKVASPGLVELPDGSRVADALTAAGGALPGTDLSGLNLARKVVDGEQIAVGVPPAPDAAPAAAAPTPGGEAEPGGPVDLNTATAEQLDTLPGVGPVTAARILEWRERNGRFTRVEQLREIEGIGERRFAQLRELVVVA